MRIFLDTEFIEDGVTIDLLSIGMVREDGKTYYAVNSEADPSKASEWVVENVLPYLGGPTKTREEIKREILEFIPEGSEIWGYYADYDWVAFCQLFGKMIDLPDGFPMFCLDVKQLLHIYGIDKKDLNLSKNPQEHNALADAKEVLDMFRAIARYMAGKKSHYFVFSDGGVPETLRVDPEAAEYQTAH